MMKFKLRYTLPVAALLAIAYYSTTGDLSRTSVIMPLIIWVISIGPTYLVWLVIVKVRGPGD